MCAMHKSNRSLTASLTISAFSLWKSLRRFFQMADDKNLSLISAGVAFYAILAVFPAITATIMLWGICGDPSLAVIQLNEHHSLIPNDVYQLLVSYLNRLAVTDGSVLGWSSILSFFLTLWLARTGVEALIRGLNTIYEVPNRAGLTRQILALWLTICLIFVLLATMTCIVVLPLIMVFFPLWGWSNIAIEFLRWSVVLTVFLVGFALIYKLGPNLGRSYPHRIIPGALFAAFGWVLSSTGFSIYLQNFSNYEQVYGSIGAVVVMLLWLFISAYLVLLGGALNVALTRRKPAKITTVVSSARAKL